LVGGRLCENSRSKDKDPSYLQDASALVVHVSGKANAKKHLARAHPACGSLHPSVVLASLILEMQVGDLEAESTLALILKRDTKIVPASADPRDRIWLNRSQ
jgi:hypothetical protein